MNEISKTIHLPKIWIPHHPPYEVTTKPFLIFNSAVGREMDNNYTQIEAWYHRSYMYSITYGAVIGIAISHNIPPLISITALLICIIWIHKWAFNSPVNFKNLDIANNENSRFVAMALVYKSGEGMMLIGIASGFITTGSYMALSGIPILFFFKYISEKNHKRACGTINLLPKEALKNS